MAHNEVAKRRGLTLRFSTTMSLWQGDHTLVSDIRELVGIPAELDHRREDYIGPILAYFDSAPPRDVVRHLRLFRGRRTIYFTMGSSGQRQLFLNVLEALSKTDYGVLCAYATILADADLPAVGDNVMLKKFVPAEAVSRMVDLVVMHGGQGSVYTTLLAGRPLVGIPAFFEQQYNLDLLVRRKTAVRIPGKGFSAQSLLRAIDGVFSNYHTYRANAEALAVSLKTRDGAQAAADRILGVARPARGANLGTPCLDPRGPDTLELPEPWLQRPARKREPKSA